MGTGKRSSDSSKTKQYKVQPSKKTKNNKEDTKQVNATKGKKKKKHSKLKKAILIFFVLIFLLGLAGVGVVAGIFFSDKWTITKEELIANGNTEVYDVEGKQIALLSASEGNGNRKVISFDEMGKYTANAYVAIEDKRFYEHSGVDILRTAKATVSYILNRGATSDAGGGSTITQQLVKNIMQDKADSGTAGIERKIREMSRAYQIEKMLSKTQILEKYLNVIFVGGNDLHGIEYGAQYYFAKPAKDLDLAEAAFMAGINNAPNMYDPYDEDEDHSELIKNRTKLVLNFMKEQNRIDDDPAEAERLYNEAVAKVEKGFEFKKGKIEIGNTSYFVEAAISDAAQDLMKEKDIDYEEAVSMIKSGGYKLYTTQNTDIQNAILKEMAKKKYGETKTGTETKNGKKVKVKDHTEVGMTIIEPSTGKVVGIGGALNSDVGTNTNYALTEGRQTGSSIKPLVNIAPGLEEKVITASTVYDDTRTDFNLPYIPKNAGGYEGLITARRATIVSSNIVNMKIFSNVGAKTAINYLHEFGLDTYTEEADNGITLAIGGASHGSSTLQMAAAYATLANGGVYIEPTFYEKLVDSNGNTIVEPEQETRRVISEANAFIVADILTDVVTQSGGTARYCAISGMDVAAKTGTTDNSSDKWLCGFTPYYAAATWYGFTAHTWEVDEINTAKYIWGNVMTTVHKDLKGKRFSKPDGVVTARVCRVSGKLATSSCKSTYTEYFATGTVPKACDGHVTVKLCKETGKVATEFCTETEEKIYTAKPEKEANAWWKVQGADKYKVPKDTCTVHTAETSKITIVNVVGKTQAEATTLLAGLTLQVIEGYDETKPNGVVLRQSLAEGTKVDKGVSITITVNKLSSSGGGTTDPNTNTNTNTSTNTNTNTPPSGNTEKPANNTQTPPNGNTQKPVNNQTTTP